VTIVELPRRVPALWALELHDCLLPPGAFCALSHQVGGLTKLMLTSCRITSPDMTIGPLSMWDRNHWWGHLVVLNLTGNAPCSEAAVQKLLECLCASGVQLRCVPVPAAGTEAAAAVGALISDFVEKHEGKYDVRPAQEVLLPAAE
jgi:hypothetical protein